MDGKTGKFTMQGGCGPCDTPRPPRLRFGGVKLPQAGSNSSESSNEVRLIDGWSTSTGSLGSKGPPRHPPPRPQTPGPRHIPPQPSPPSPPLPQKPVRSQKTPASQPAPPPPPAPSASQPPSPATGTWAFPTTAQWTPFVTPGYTLQPYLPVAMPQVIVTPPGTAPPQPQQQLGLSGAPTSAGYGYTNTYNPAAGPIYYRTAPLPPNRSNTLDSYYRQYAARHPSTAAKAAEAAKKKAEEDAKAAAKAKEEKIAAEGFNTLYFSGGEDTRQQLYRAGLNGVNVDIGPWKWVGEPGNGGFRICEVRKKKVTEVPKELDGLTRGLAAHLLLGVEGAKSHGWTEADGKFPPPEPAGFRGQGGYWNSVGVGSGGGQVQRSGGGGGYAGGHCGYGPGGCECDACYWRWFDSQNCHSEDFCCEGNCCC